MVKITPFWGVKIGIVGRYVYVVTVTGKMKPNSRTKEKGEQKLFKL